MGRGGDTLFHPLHCCCSFLEVIVCHQRLGHYIGWRLGLEFTVHSSWGLGASVGREGFSYDIPLSQNTLCSAIRAIAIFIYSSYRRPGAELYKCDV
jgi:hypothetical protein